MQTEITYKTHDKDYFKNYYWEKNVEMECECGAVFKRMYRSKHVKCKKHLFLLQRKKSEEEEKKGLEEKENVGV